MSITRKGSNLWLIKVSVFDKNKGYPVPKQRTIKGTRFEAQKAEIDLKRTLQAQLNGSLTYTHRISTFSEAIALYRERLQKKGNLSSHHSRKIDLVQSELGHLALNAVPDQLKQIIIHLEGQGKGPATINRRLEIVRAVFNYLVRIEVLDKNPITENRFPKLKEQPRDLYWRKMQRKGCWPHKIIIVLKQLW